MVDFCVNSFDNLNAGAIRQFTIGRMGWLGLWTFIRPFMVGAEGYRFKYFHLESCGICVLLWFICLSDLILKSFCRVCIDRLEVIFRYEGLYFNVVVLCRKNDYRISFIIFCNDSFIAYCFVWACKLVAHIEGRT